MKDTVENTGGYYDPNVCDRHEFAALIEQTTQREHVPNGNRPIEAACLTAGFRAKTRA
jgi:hypothetical protein